MALLTTLLSDEAILIDEIQDMKDTRATYFEELNDNIDKAKAAFEECQNGDPDAALDAIQDAWSDFYGCEYPLHSGDSNTSTVIMA